MKENQQQKILETYTVDSLKQASALLHPIRAEIISYLKQPSSAAEVARKLQESAQKVNYHVKALEKVGLVQRVGTRNKRNLVEVLYHSIAKTFIMSDSLGQETDAIQKMKDQSSLRHLVDMGERIKRNAVSLSHHVDQDEDVPSAALDFSINLHPDDRKVFVEEYVDLVKQLTQKYATKKKQTDSVQYESVLAVYPKRRKEEE